MVTPRFANSLALTIAVVVGCCLLPAAQSAPGWINGRVVGGEDAALGQFPHQVSLRNGGSHSCGGSILSRNYILTAAHCVTNVEDENGFHAPIAASRFTIRAGSNDRFSGGVLIQVVEVIVHENYGKFLNDVALLRLESPLFYSNSIKAIDLPTANTPADADIIISGWGLLKHQGDLPRYLQYNTLKSITVEKCGELIDFGVESELCLLHEADNGACNGDSGGPAVYNNQVVGVAGFVVDGCGSTYPDGYARVYYFNDWIRQHSDV
ncbi:serine protease SP24D-like [Drosophila madeirensis]|uniref:trypsin n=1 Tax=Drosophila madeirensis TaxID=30013 RepID=A0AAU9G128_DROMD